MRLLWHWIVFLVVSPFLLLALHSTYFNVLLAVFFFYGVLLLFFSVRQLFIWIRANAFDKKIKKQADAVKHRDATTESPLERKLAHALRENNISFKREFLISRTRVDFAFPAKKLAVECDGFLYHSTRDQKKHDAARDAFLERNGWTVLRFSSNTIHTDMDGVIRKIRERLQ